MPNLPEVEHEQAELSDRERSGPHFRADQQQDQSRAKRNDVARENAERLGRGVGVHGCKSRNEIRDRGALPDRAKWLARLRDHDGYMSDCEPGPEGALRIVEHHSPILDLLRTYPIVAKLETEMFQRLLRAPVRREEASASGLFSATFFIG